MSSPLLFVTADVDEGEWFAQQFPNYQVIAFSDMSQAESHWHEYDPAALIAPISRQSIKLSTALRKQNDLPHRPLIVLLANESTQVPPTDPVADFVIPAAWLPSTLPTALKMRADNLVLSQQATAAAERNSRRDAEHKRSTEEIHLLKNAIVRTVAHELRTPMLQVKAAVAMLLDNSDQDHDMLVDYAMGATTRLENVIKNVTQLAESLDEIELQPALVNESVSQAVRNLRRSWEYKDQVGRIQVEVPGDLPFVLADKQAIGIVLQLLLDNALKFSKQRVKVSASAKGDGVLIAVADKGIGIAPAQLETIFEPFYQIDHTEARRFGGIGVGLTIARLILERHHTTIEVKSSLGKGSTFSFLLPCTEC